ncbi:hypothetical protein AN403_2716 [Pseudomonas fluorescens]|uniref:Uncharacterized protein n=1 Tax=Pseudomonas fluorescens TaxID=294 RepID=A0A0P8XEZ3_PSEFL|nr:hypothetical protein AN403_2716 [Pseudomonas fluorescens]
MECQAKWCRLTHHREQVGAPNRRSYRFLRYFLATMTARIGAGSPSMVLL